jgi:hypothetical protein
MLHGTRLPSSLFSPPTVPRFFPPHLREGLRRNESVLVGRAML